MTVNYHAWVHRSKARGGTDPIESLALWPVKVFRDDITVDTTHPFTWKVPQDLDNHTLVRVEGFLAESGGGACTVQLVKNPAGGADDMLSTVLTIPSGQINDDGNAVVDTTVADVSFEDHIKVTVVSASGKGLGVYMYFLAGPDAVSAIGIEGAQGPAGPTGATGPQGPQGDPGGVVDFTGAWSSVTTYSADDSVSHNGSSYVALTGSTDVEPGVDAGWETSWMLLATGSTGLAEDVSITDTTGYYTATDVEAALAELGAAGATDVFEGDFTPTLTAPGGTNPTLGSGSQQTGRYVKRGRLVHIWVGIKFGTSGAAAGSGNYRVANLPYNFASGFPVGTNWEIGFALGSGMLKDNSASDARQIVTVHRGSTEQNQVLMNLTGGTSFVNNAGPWTWAAQDELLISFSYETDD